VSTLLSIVIPCLNEAAVEAEIIVANNGRTANSVGIGRPMSGHPRDEVAQN
jgi:glycosyltransferase involved in cell wall biosynthesis